MMRVGAASLAFVGAVLAGSRSDDRTFAVLQFNGPELTSCRADPIVTPGQVSSHVHTVVGASNFALDATGDKLRASRCTNAKIKADKSAYWYPRLYFRDPQNGKFEPVPMYYTNVYYFFDGTDDDIKAFPVGLQMVSGNATTRIAPAGGGKISLDPADGPINHVQWTCPRAGEPGSRVAAWPFDSDGSRAGMPDPGSDGTVGVGFPSCDCDGNYSPLRADVHFPSCYNPAAGLTNFRENMAWPSRNGASNSRRLNCPSGYIHVPHIFLEVYWNTQLFAGRWDSRSGNGEQPFVLANGDATGFSSHADFMAAWDEEKLQYIIDNCNTGHGGIHTCPGMEDQVNTDSCTIDSRLVEEDIDGDLDNLPGLNPLAGWRYGPGNGGSNYPIPAAPIPIPPLGNAQPYSPPAAGIDINLGAGAGVGIDLGIPKPVANNEAPRPVAEPKKEAVQAAAACVPKVVTVWETVTVAGDKAKATAAANAKPTPDSYNRRRHAHGHAAHRRS